MKMSVKYCCSVLILSCLLTACLPGKKQEEKVISDALQATQQVAAERVAADMSNAAQSLMASSKLTPGVMKSLQSNDLQTVTCNNGKNVIAFIPSTSKMAQREKGTLPEVMANRISDQLKMKFPASAVGKRDLIDKCPEANIESVAINSPVLFLDNVSANLAETKDDNAVSVNVASCDPVKGKTVPGVIVTKKMKDGTTHVDNRCGKPIEAMDQVVTNLDIVHDESMPDWKSQLLNKGSTATVNFKCVIRADSGKCTPLTKADAGIETQCDAASAKEEYLSNPVPSATGFTSGAADADCGSGWSGQLVARVKSKQCTITRQGVPEKPATVVDIAYVAAKCHKDAVVNIPTQCPSSSGQFYAKYQRVDMDVPTILEPQPTSNGTTESLIALPGYQPDAKAATEIASLTRTSDTYVPSVNLRGLNGDADKFSAALVKDMGAHAKLSTLSGCNVVGNQCVAGAGGVPEHVVVILDRSASMGSKDTPNLLTVPSSMTQAYSCKAGLSNIFASNKTSDACTAAKNYLKEMPYSPPAAGSAGSKVMDFVVSPWNGTSGPRTDTAKAAYKIMEDSLTDKAKFIPYLQYSLANGWDCSGRTKVGSTDKETFPDDMYGTCSGAQSCDTCPGECSPTTISDAGGQQVQRVEAAEIILKNLARLKLKPNTKITLASFLNDGPNVQTMTYCPQNHQNANGTCDITLERQAITDMFARPPEAKEYVKPVSRTVTIPTEAPKTPKIILVPDVRMQTERKSEGSGESSEAPPNMVMVGRFHEGNENGGTIYEYATLKAINQDGQPVAGKITIEDPQWSDRFPESSSTFFVASAGRVIDGRFHTVGRNGTVDENGDTSYRTSVVKFNGQPVVVSENRNSLRITESDSTSNSNCIQRKKHINPDQFPCTQQSIGVFFHSPLNQVIVGRWHEGDENGDTIYQTATINVTCTSDNKDLCVKQCDVSMCTSLPAITANGDWETWATANDRGTVDKSGDYEYRSCTTGSLGCNADQQPMSDSGFHLITPAYAIAAPCADGTGAMPTNAWITYKDGSSVTSCTERRLRQDWETSTFSKQEGDFDASALPAPDYQDTDSYQFQSCSEVTDCTQEQKTCDTTKSADDCAAAASCKTRLATDVNNVKDLWLTGVTGGDCTGNICQNRVSTYCAERLKKPNASSDNADLEACLDQCGGKVTATTDINICKTATDLFSGTSTTKCDIVKVPAAVDYSYPGYTGKTVNAVITHRVVARQGEAGAVPVAKAVKSANAVWGADFGGNTPLYETIDAVLSNALVTTDLNNKKAMDFIVLTDGLDTGDGSSIVKDLCDNKLGPTLLTRLNDLDPNAVPYFISLNDSGTGLAACAQKMPDSFIGQHLLSTAIPLLSEQFTGNSSGSTTSNPVSIEKAQTFCDQTYGSHYSDERVTTLSDLSSANAAVCRKFEVQ